MLYLVGIGGRLNAIQSHIRPIDSLAVLTGKTGTVRLTCGECEEVIVIAILASIQQLFTLSGVLVPPVANDIC